MESSTGFPEGGFEPDALLHDVSHWLIGAAEHLMLGLLLGLFIAHAMRVARLRWTWAVLGLCLFPLAGDVPAGLAWPVGVAGVVALVRGRKREAIDDGSGARRHSHGVASVLLLTIRIAVKRWRIRTSRWFVGDALLLGYDRDCRAAEIPVQGSAGGAHTLVVGAAGSGKTVTQTWVATRAIEAGMPTIVVDPKDDPGLAEQVRAAARRAQARLFEWSPEGPCVYNPYGSGSDSEIADKALAGERFTEPHYLRQAQRFLGREVRILRSGGIETSLATLAENLDPDRLELLLRRLPEADAAADREYLDALTSRQRSDLSGVRDRLAILAESDIGEWLDPTTVGASTFTLLNALRTRSVVLFRLRSDSRPLIMQMLGGAIVLDLLTATAALQKAPIPSIAVIDEFAALAAPHIGGLFGRARGAGMSLLLGTQEISDLQLPGREHLLKQVAGNLTTTISHRQVNPDSAQWISTLAGLQPRWSTTHSSDGRRTYRLMSAPQISPDHVRMLEPGQAAVIVHSGSTRGARIAQVLAASAL